MPQKEAKWVKKWLSGEKVRDSNGKQQENEATNLYSPIKIQIADIANNK